MFITQMIVLFISAGLITYLVTRLAAALLPNILPEIAPPLPVGFAPATALIGFAIVIEIPSGTILAMLLLMLGFSRHALVGNTAKANAILLALAGLLTGYDFFQHYLPAETTPLQHWPVAALLLTILAISFSINYIVSQINAPARGAFLWLITMSMALCIIPLTISDISWFSAVIGGLLLSCIIGWIAAKRKLPNIYASGEFMLPATILITYQFVLIALQTNPLVGTAGLAALLIGQLVTPSFTKKESL